MAKLTECDRIMQIDGRAGVWSVPAWCAQAGWSTPKFYTLNPGPRRAKIGRSVRITESPREYFERMAAQATT